VYDEVVNSLCVVNVITKSLNSVVPFIPVTANAKLVDGLASSTMELIINEELLQPLLLLLKLLAKVPFRVPEVVEEVFVKVNAIDSQEKGLRFEVVIVLNLVSSLR